jgi:hypothetical protein
MVTNVSEYTPVWPEADLDDSKKLDDYKKGYLFNGLKSGSDLKTHDLFQMNVCHNRRVKTRFCFRNNAGQKVTMERASYRVFDIDHSASHWKNGPEVLQFNCTGGTFSVFGEHPYMSYPGGTPVIVEEGVTSNGQDKLTYLCPEDDMPVTFWSRRTGDAPDNPTNASMDTLGIIMENSMVLINYANVDCFEITFAPMPSKYHQDAWENPTTGEKSAGYPVGLNASAGGNPLNSTLQLTPLNFPDMEEGQCPPDLGGRNWLMAGLADTTGVTPPCTTVSIGNDPMFVVNGLHRHFWLPTGKASALMEWNGPAGGHQFILSGETFGHGSTQWFRSYVVRADGRELIRVSISDAPVKAPRSKTSRGKPVKLRTIDLWVDAKPVTTTGKTIESSRVKGVSVLPSVQPVRLIGSAHAENIEIQAPGLALSISSARANKYGKEEQQVRWAHLNMKMRSSLPAGASGLVAELSGMKPLSKKTKSFLNVPKAVMEHRERKKHEKGHKQSEGHKQSPKAHKGKGRKGSPRVALVAE